MITTTDSKSIRLQHKHLGKKQLFQCECRSGAVDDAGMKLPQKYEPLQKLKLWSYIYCLLSFCQPQDENHIHLF